MGTRCLTFVYEYNNQILVNIYRQFDGYIECHGRELAKYMKGRTILNGIPLGLDKTTAKYSNGMGCFAAGLVGHLKGNSLGNIYLNNILDEDCGQDYEYHIYIDKVIVKNYRKNEMFRGTWNEFAEFCNGEDDE